MDIKTITHYMSQTEAAALAVLASHVRHNINETSQERGDVDQMEQQVMRELAEIEDAALESVARNDGNVTKWIGFASKQMNPLLS